MSQLRRVLLPWSESRFILNPFEGVRGDSSRKRIFYAMFCELLKSPGTIPIYKCCQQLAIYLISVYEAAKLELSFEVTRTNKFCQNGKFL